MSTDDGLQEYRCHKAVKAGQIFAVIFDHGTDEFVITLQSGMKIRKKRDWMERTGATIDGYYVLYEDGYDSYSPKAAFEKGYSVIE